MRNRSLRAAAILVATTLFFAVFSFAQSGSNDNDLKAELESLHNRWITAYNKGDGATMDRMEVPNLIPGDGVYAVQVLYENQKWSAAANIGPNPTFGERARKVEVHLLDFSENLYGKSLAVDFVDRLRDTRAFADVSQLLAQLRIDVERTRAILQARS